MGSPSLAGDPGIRHNPLAVQVRARELQSGFAQFSLPYLRVSVGLIATAGAAIATGQLSRSLWVAVAVGVILAAITIAIAWSPLLQPAFRASAELFFDHYFHERAEWRKETGSEVPRGIPAARSWLVAHPSGPGRATVLMMVGDLDKANQAIDSIEPETPEEAFGIEILRKTGELLAGRTPDLSALHATWRELPDPIERRHRRECLALLDAQIATDGGADPIPPLATARAEIRRLISRHVVTRLFWVSVGFAILTVAFIAEATDLLLR